jgi:hypothetical protein
MNKEFGMAEEVSLTIGTILAMACRGMRKTTKTAIWIIFIWQRFEPSIFQT